ncbi:hypothetical protein [Yoonia sp.]|uniref:hypothetical protein n=1 Tax=Yoonia sp. TaxID=2212373 RepID=UPI0023B764E3
MDRRRFIIGLPLALSACGATEVWAPDDVVSRAIYREPGRKYLTLYTMKKVRDNSGAHTALLINANQRVMFDPAGSWSQDVMPERNDVLFGVSPRLEEYYVSFHARKSFYVIGQNFEVPPEVAEQAFNLSLQAGPVAQANCARVTSKLLRRLPGFGSIGQTWFPNSLQRDFGQLPNVVTQEYREDDDDDKSIAAAQIRTALGAGQ